MPMQRTGVTGYRRALSTEHGGVTLMEDMMRREVIEIGHCEIC
jgi:hypothetical protein